MYIIIYEKTFVYSFHGNGDDCSHFAAQPSGTLPVLVIETQNHQAINSKDTYVVGTYYLDPRGVEGVEAIGSAESPLPLQIKGRGNYTWWAFNKNPIA